MNVQIKKLQAKTLTSKKALKEVLNFLPNAKTYKKKHVPAVGYVLYIKDVAGNTLGQLTKTNGELQLCVK